ARNPVADGANETPSSEVKHCAFAKPGSSCCTVTTPLGAMFRRPLVASHMSTGTKTLALGRSAAGRANATGFTPGVDMAPLSCTVPEGALAAGAEGLNGGAFQPLTGVSLPKVPPGMKETPSSEVRHWALVNGSPFFCSTVTVPLGWMCRRPLVALHRSTLT